MSQPQLYINGEKVILADNSEVALSFQINNLGELRNQQGNTSNQFEVPLTLGDNNRILGNPANIPFTDDIPYTQLKAKVVQGGIETIQSGKGEIKECNDEVASVVVTSGNVDFFDLLEAKISELWTKFVQYEHTWDLTNAADSQTKTSGWIYPIIDYGAGLSGNIDVRNLRPAFFLHTAVQEICDATGYTISGKVLDLDFYKRILLPLSVTPFEHGKNYSNYIENFKAVAKRPGYNYKLISQATAQTSIDLSAQEDPSGSWNGVTYTAKDTFDLAIELNYNIYVEQTYFGSGSVPAWKIQIRKNGTVIAENFHESDPLIGNATYTDQILMAETNLAVNDTIEIWAEQFPTTNRAFCHLTVRSNQGLIIDPIEELVTFGQKVQIEKVLPDVAQKDLIKDMFQKFGIFCITDNLRKEIKFVQFKEIIANKLIADDWSDIMIDESKNVSYRLGDYARKNKMMYTEDETVKKYYGDSFITVANENLKQESELFTSMFSATEMGSYPSVTTTGIKAPVIDMSKANYRILLDRKVETPVTFTDGTSTSDKTKISLPYFEGTTDGLTWEQLRKDNYYELEKVLYRCKKIVRLFRLTPEHIQKLDFSKPVYIRQLGAYFYKNKVDSFIEGIPTQVELVRL